MQSIDTFKEAILSLDEAAKHISKIGGVKRNRNILMRWANRGVSGVKLRTIQIGSDIFTSKESVNDFLNESRRARQNKVSKATSSGIRQTKVDAEVARELGI